MKKNLFLYIALAVMVSCQGISEENNTGNQPLSVNHEFKVHAVANFTQDSFSEVDSRSGSDEGLAQDKVKYILIEVVPDLMKFDTDTFKVAAGEKIILELDNMDGMQHNMVISSPGTLEKVGAAADAMLRDPKAAENHYVPQIPEVLFATELVGPGEIFTLEFTVPTEPGYYPFVCTFPGHWRMMNGIMEVEK